jgi:F-type H+-transporting ATPase subunit b
MNDEMIMDGWMITAEDAKSKAGALMNLVPGNSVLTKTGVLSLLTGLTAYGISKEIIILHSETLIVVGTGIVLALAYKNISGPFQEWADSEREVIFPFLFPFPFPFRYSC